MQSEYNLNRIQNSLCCPPQEKRAKKQKQLKRCHGLLLTFEVLVISGIDAA